MLAGVLLLPFVLIVLFLAAVGLAFLFEQRQRRRAAPTLRSRGEPFQILSLADAFEPDAAALWITQWPALQQICACGERGLDAGSLRRFYSDSALCFPELYEGSDFEAWLEFLEGEDLISRSDDSLRLTPDGAAFLRSCLGVPAVMAQ